MAIFALRSHGHVGATQSLDGLVIGLVAPAVFFLLLALTLPTVGLCGVRPRHGGSAHCTSAKHAGNPVRSAHGDVVTATHGCLGQCSGMSPRVGQTPRAV